MRRFFKIESLNIIGLCYKGSFKLRGVINQFNNLQLPEGNSEQKLVTFSAGNYGKAFSYMCKKEERKGKGLI